jgi:hypothetical protein
MERRVVEGDNYTERPQLMRQLSHILARRQVFSFRQRRPQSQALERRVAEGGNYAARPQFISLLRCILARRQVFCFR